VKIQIETMNLPGADVRHIFNHDIASCTHPDVVGNYLYSGRALGLSSPADIVQLHPFLKKEWSSISQHYRRIGLSHSENIIWDISFDVLKKYQDLDASLFYFGEKENKARRDHAWMKVVDYINSKNNFVALASHLRIAIPKTLCFRGKEWFAGIELFPYPCYLKAAISVAGMGIFRCETSQSVIKALAYFNEGVPLQVQAEVDAKIFLNMQYYSDDKGLMRWLVTEQVLDGYSHKGNRYPSGHQPWWVVEPMAEWLHSKGMKGIFAFDVAIIETQDEPEYMPIECNPRYNGASYPSGIACKLGLKSWLAKECHTRHERLDDINLEGIEYDSMTKIGIVIVNWGTVLAGKLGVLIAGTQRQQAGLEAELLTRL